MIKHGLSNSRIYGIWNGVIQRCENPHRKAYPRYGGRGITVCEEWHDFQKFHEWAIENGYSDKLTIDRIDNNGNYEPLNCRWVNYKIQANNMRKNVYFEINGIERTLKEWAEIYNIEYKTVHRRIKVYHWDVISALTIFPKRGTKNGRYTLHS